MADDDNIGQGGGSEDPWAGLDADAAANGSESLAFPEFESFLQEAVPFEESAAGGEPAALDIPPETASVESVAAEVFPSTNTASANADPLAKTLEPDEVETGEPAVGGSSEAESFGVPTFDALSLGAQDGVFSDEAAWNSGDPSPSAGSEPLDASEAEPPLAVFPPADTGGLAEERGGSAEDRGIREEDHGLLAGEPWSDAGGDDFDADALAHLEDASDVEGDPGVVAFSQPDSAPSPSPNSLDTGSLDTDESIVVGEPNPGDGESLVGQSLIDHSTIQIGTGQSGILSFEDWGDSAEATAANASSESATEENPLGEPSFEDDDSVGQADGVFGEAAGLAAAVGGAAAVAPVRRVIKRRSGGSGIGAVVSVLLGGVLAIPITIAILFWGFKKDPFQIAPKIPASLAFLLPPQFQVAGQGGRTLPGLPAPGGKAVASRSLEDLVAAGAATEETPPAGGEGTSEEGAVKDEPAAVDVDLDAVASNSGPSEPKRPAPLDTSELDGAVTAADRAMGRLLTASDQDPDYKRLLKDWYTSLSKVGEETVSLEQKAAQSGAEFIGASPAVKRTIGRILADERSNEQFAKLSRMWLKSRGRTSDGVILPAVLGSSRQVGAWWVSRVRVSDDPAVPEIAVLSRSQPDASEGDAVVVLGLIFEPGVVWAAVCDRFEPVSAAAEEDVPSEEPKPAAPARTEDLFPLE